MFEIPIWRPLAGIALFLLAMSLIEAGIRAGSAQRLRSLLLERTHTPLRGLLTGSVSTAVLQSSSLVGLLVLAFVGARVLPMRNALAVIFGANLGTTATGWIVATIGFKLDLEALALPLVAVGGLVLALTGHERQSRYGRLLLGLGLLLLGLQYMKTDVAALFGMQMLAQLSALEYLLFGVVVSAIIQSSSATMVIALSALAAGAIDLPAAAAIAIGADLGTTSTVLLGAIGGSASKKRVALAHFLFNLITDLIAFVVRMPMLAMLAGIGDPLFLLVAFHSSFNLLGVVLFLPLVGPFAAFLERCFTKPSTVRNVFLKEVPVTVPDAAVQAVAQEVSRLISRAVGQNCLVMGQPMAKLGGELQLEDDFWSAYRATKELEGEILQYALSIDRSALGERDSQRLEQALSAMRDAVVSSKALKDLYDDLESLARPALRSAIDVAQHRLYADLQPIVVAPEQATEEQLEHLARLVDKTHEEIHQGIFRDVRLNLLEERSVSSVLNVNRLLYNSNQAIVEAASTLIDTHGLAAAA